MRLRKADLRERVKVDLALRFTRTGLTSFAGLELVRRYFRQLDLVRCIRRHVGGAVPGTDYGVSRMVVLLLTLLIVGGRRVRHVSYLAGDPLVARLTGLKRLATARTIGRWLEQFRVRHLQGLAALNAEALPFTHGICEIGNLMWLFYSTAFGGSEDHETGRPVIRSTSAVALRAVKA